MASATPDNNKAATMFEADPGARAGHQEQVFTIYENFRSTNNQDFSSASNPQQFDPNPPDYTSISNEATPFSAAAFSNPNLQPIEPGNLNLNGEPIQNGTRPLPPISGIVNPNYMPYPPPPYGPETENYSPAQFHNGNDHGTGAGANASSLINGRSSVAVVCSFCYNSVLTLTTESPSPALQNSRTAYYSFAGSLLLIFGIFGILIFVAGATLTLFIMPGFIIFLLVSTILVSRVRRRAIASYYSDITHTCPICNKTLGVSSGVQFLQMAQMNGRERY